jgi:hypothetical protein
MVLGSRHGSPFLPRRDYSFFVGSVRTLRGAGPSLTPLPAPDLDAVAPW